MRLPADCSAALAPEGLEDRLIAELGEPWARFGRLFVYDRSIEDCPFAQQRWLEPQLLPAPSVKAAATALRGIQRSWWPYGWAFHRRLALITEALPPVSARPLVFPEAPKTSPLGAYTLVENGLLLASAAVASPLPNGDLRFVEDHTGPPSRAYLKLWEALTRLGRRPGPGERCIELGASPGGWTWVLAELGASVHAVDRAGPDPRLVGRPEITWTEGDAFKMSPDRVEGVVDWLLSDLICYPERLYAFVRAWLDSGRARNIVVTVKLQGEGQREAIAAFAALPGGRLLHLTHNKHELTWMWPV